MYHKQRPPLRLGNEKTVDVIITRFARSHEEKLHHYLEFQVRWFPNNTGIVETLRSLEVSIPQVVYIDLKRSTTTCSWSIWAEKIKGS